MTNMHRDDESDAGDDKSHHIHKKPNLYVGIIIASILIASPFILYNYFSSPTVESQQLTPIEGEEPIVPVPPASEINPESINMIQSSIDNLQQSIINLDSKLNQQTNQLFQLSQSEKKEEPKEKSMFNFSDLNPFAEKKEETPAPIPIPNPAPASIPAPIPPPASEPEPNPSFNFNPSPKPLEQTPFPAPASQSEDPLVNFNDSEPIPPTVNTEFKTGGQKRSYKKKHGKKQNYSKKLLNKFLKKLSTL